MSLIIRIERFAAEPRLLYLRGLHAEVGENQAGILTTQAVVRPFFTIAAGDVKPLLSLQVSAAHYNGELLPVGSRVRLASGDTITARDYRFTFIITSAHAEVAARAGRPGPLPRAVPEARIRIGQAQRAFPLIPNQQLLLGRSPNAPLYIDVAGISAEHLAITYVPNEGVWITPRNGAASIDGQTLTEPYLLAESTGTLLLEPLKVALQIGATHKDGDDHETKRS